MGFVSYLLILCLVTGTFVRESEGTLPETKSDLTVEASLGDGGDPEENNGTAIRDRIRPGAMFPQTYPGYPGYPGYNSGYPSYPSQTGNGFGTSLIGNGFGTYFQHGCTCPGGNTGYINQQHNPNPINSHYPYMRYNSHPNMNPRGQNQSPSNSGTINSGTSRTDSAQDSVAANQ